jgi:glycogen debranching enzyme
MSITISEEAAFLVCDDWGDVSSGAEFGLYDQDTRFLSRLDLRLDGQRPVLLAARAVAAHEALHFLANPALTGIARGQLALVRRRSLADSMAEELVVTNHGDSDATFTLDLLIEADFAHIFEVKRGISTEAGSDGRDRPQPTILDGGRRLVFDYRAGEAVRRLLVDLTLEPQEAGRRCRFSLSLEPRARWRLCLAFRTLVGPSAIGPLPDAGTGCDPCDRPISPPIVAHRLHRQHEMVHRAPRLETDSSVLAAAYATAVEDFAQLCRRAEELGPGEMTIAAGIPWYVALFGRDSLIAAYEAVLFWPDRAVGVLHTLARLQGVHFDPTREEEPGKILHEHRYGDLGAGNRLIPGFPYYGSIDATPLFLMLLAAVLRVTGDVAVAADLRPNAERALDWLEQFGDRDGDGYLEYKRRGDTGLDNQGWKDSFDSVRFHDGGMARPPIALVEVQGYAIAAWLGMADVFDGLGERRRAAVLRDRATAMKARLNDDFWLAEPAYFAEALDGDKRPVDSITSNPGHLLWTGAANAERARDVARRVLSPELFSGWGIRTMGKDEAGYNPISYHDGSVWPHDSALILAGLARYGFVEEAVRLADGLLAALADFPERRLPELFAGYGRDEVPFPVEYPTASRPQAWASASVFLLLSAMTGLDPLAGVVGRPFLPSGVGRIRLEGVWWNGRRRTVDVRRRGSRIVRRVSGDTP